MTRLRRIRRAFLRCAAFLALAHLAVGIHAVHVHFHDHYCLGHQTGRESVRAGLPAREAGEHSTAAPGSMCPICLFLAYCAASAPEAVSSLAEPACAGDVCAEPREAAVRLAALGPACPRAPPAATI